MSEIVLTRCGSGEKSLVLFPGWLHPFEYEEKFLDLLGKHFSLVLVGLPGYFNEIEPKKFYDFKALASLLHQLLTEENLEKSQLLGFSLGCYLIMNLLNEFPSETHPNPIFIGCPSETYHVPAWAKIFLMHKNLIGMYRKFETLKQYGVSLALKQVSKNPEAVFTASDVSLLGAFDSLVSALRNTAKVDDFLKQATFIYGSKDPHLRGVKSKQPEKLHTIKTAPHHCMSGFEEILVSLIREIVAR